MRPNAAFAFCLCGGDGLHEGATIEPAEGEGSLRMALMLGQLYDALRADNVPDDKAAAEEVAHYEGEMGKLRLEMSELRLEVSEQLNRVDSELRLHRWMIGFLIAEVLGGFALQWQILLRLPS